MLPALAVVGALAVAGCSGDDPRASTTGSSTSTNSSSTTSSPTSTTATSPPAGATVTSMQVPNAAEVKTKSGAAAFTKFYWTQASDVLVSNDATLVASLSSPTCSVCKSFSEIASKQAAAGHHAERSPFDIKLVSVKSGENNTYVVEVAGEEVAVRTIDKEGRVVTTSKPGVITWRTNVQWTAGRWLVTDFKGV
jgi:hypothetical protein